MILWLSVIKSQNIRFDSMAVGQKSQYVLFKGSDYSIADSATFVYVASDTLELEIVEKSRKGFLVKESMRSGQCWTLHPNPFAASNKEVYYYRLKRIGDSLRVILPDTMYASRIFGYGDVFPLNNDQPETVKALAWKTDHRYIESLWIAKMEICEGLNQTYHSVIVLTDNRPMRRDGSGCTYIYTASNGMVRRVAYGWGSDHSWGWDLIPQPIAND